MRRSPGVSGSWNASQRRKRDARDGDRAELQRAIDVIHRELVLARRSRRQASRPAAGADHDGACADQLRALLGKRIERFPSAARTEEESPEESARVEERAAGRSRASSNRTRQAICDLFPVRDPHHGASSRGAVRSRGCEDESPFSCVLVPVMEHLVGRCSGDRCVPLGDLALDLGARARDACARSGSEGRCSFAFGSSTVGHAPSIQ